RAAERTTRRATGAGGSAVRHIGWVAGAALGLAAWSSDAGECVLPRLFELERVNRRLDGHVVDYTHDHGADRRLWSEALGERRDLYVYLPPGFDPCRSYPVLFWLHGFSQDEQAFLDEVVDLIDAGVADGRLPPLIVAAPDGSK